MLKDPTIPSTAQPITVAQHILDQQRQHSPRSTGEFSWLLSGLTLATKMVAAQVRRAGLTDLLGATGDTNVQGESVQKLDVFANRALLHCLGNRGNVGILASEENDEPVVVVDNADAGRYVVVFDPLDGSSNIEVDNSVGTIFSILRRRQDGVSNPSLDVCQPGLRQVAAGYVLYGPSVVLVYTTGSGVWGFTLEPSIGAYVLSHPNLRMPDRGSAYAVNEANSDSFPDHYRRYLQWLRSRPDDKTYSSRYAGALVADFHRTLLRGGVFFYPPTQSYPQGKLRLLYEANPIAFLAEQAGGMATNGDRRILEITPRDLHERTPLVVGSRYEVEKFLEFAQDA